MSKSPKFTDLPKEIVALISSNLSPSEIRKLGTVSKDLLANEYLQAEFLRQKPLKDVWENYSKKYGFDKFMNLLVDNRLDVLEWKFNQGLNSDELEDLMDIQAQFLQFLRNHKKKLPVKSRTMYRKFFQMMNQAIMKEVNKQLSRLA